MSLFRGTGFHAIIDKEFWVYIPHNNNNNGKLSTSRNSWCIQIFGFCWIFQWRLIWITIEVRVRIKAGFSTAYYNIFCGIDTTFKITCLFHACECIVSMNGDFHNGFFFLLKRIGCIFLSYSPNIQLQPFNSTYIP